MRNRLYWHLARNNLWNNRRTYLPFLLASSLLAFAQYSFYMMTFNPGFAQVRGGMNFVMILQLGMVVVGLFTAIFLFYANGFLIKRRKKELGLYSILGMEKKHIARVVRYELHITYLLSMVFGLGLGVLLARFLFLLVRFIIRLDVPLTSSVSMPAIGLTMALFFVLFVLLELFNTVQVRTVSPIALMHGEMVGEREPKARWILAVLGVVCLGAGYWMAQMVQNPMTAIALFFVAVILVIIGTYLLFLAGSIAILQLLKRNDKFYYKAGPFVTISNMLYRMKQNAAGLASIAILCTMAMVTIGTTVALYSGSENMLTDYYPYDYQVCSDTADELPETEMQAIRMASALGVEVAEMHSFTGYALNGIFEGDALLDSDSLDYSDLNDYGRVHDILLMTLSEFNRLEGASFTLGENEVYWYSDRDTALTTLSIDGETFAVKTLDALAVRPCMGYGSFMGRNYLIVPGDDVAKRVLAAIANDDADEALLNMTQWNLEATREEYQAYSAQIAKNQPEWRKRELRDKTELRDEWYALHGGLLFAGIFLGMVFLMGTALVIYFKQISEGYQDHDRYIILQKVGMGAREVKRTVNRQILTVFFLPLLVAICHVGGSLNMITKMLMLFGLTDTVYVVCNCLGAALGVAAVYTLFYWRTAKSYYKLVRFT